MERVHKVKSSEKRVWKFKISITDTTFITRVLKELGFTNIKYVSKLPEGNIETIYNVVSTWENGITIGLKRDESKDWEFVGCGKEREIQRLSWRFVDLLGVYQTMAVLDVQGINYQVSKNDNNIIIQIF